MNEGLPAIGTACKMTVVIPARNEADCIVRCLEALGSQDDLSAFDVVILANNCTDGTAARARAFARTSRFQLHVLETTLPPHAANVGTARKMLMDRAAARFLAAGKPLGVIATTDADTTVAPDWADRLYDAMRYVDAVAGFVEVSPAAQQAMPEPVRRLYLRERAFRRAWTELESLIDPQPEDPAPRHGAFVGASFAVSAGMYRRCGGIVPLACLEDREFLCALRRFDARVRFSLEVRAWTSARRVARVTGGFGTFIGHLYERGSVGHTFLVEHPAQIVAELEGRAAARRIWRRAESDADLSLVCMLFAIDGARCRKTLDRSMPFGTAFERLTAFCGRRDAAYPKVPVDDAISALRFATASRRAAAAIDRQVASGTG